MAYSFSRRVKLQTAHSQKQKIRISNQIAEIKISFNYPIYDMIMSLQITTTIDKILRF